MIGPPKGGQFPQRRWDLDALLAVLVDQTLVMPAAT